MGAALTRNLCLLALLAAAVPALSGPAPAQAHGAEVLIEGIPSVAQSYNLSCEYAAVQAVTTFWGNAISEDHLMREVPRHPNPHKGFRGDINGEGGGITDYGIYAEPLATALEGHDYDATVFYRGAARLKAEIQEGHPVIVWLTIGKNITRPVYSRTYEGEQYKLVPSEHTVVVYGYDEAGVYVMDVGDGGKYYTDWESFLRRWSYFDEMALLIHP